MIIYHIDTQTGIDDDLIETAADFAISQNYPNPFNASTTIKYSLATPSNVAVEIFDLLGRKVTIFDEGQKSAGEHKLTWNAENQPSGVYFYKIQTEDYTETKRMMLLK